MNRRLPPVAAVVSFIDRINHGDLEELGMTKRPSSLPGFHVRLSFPFVVTALTTPRTTVK
jgi:hypothetical protein